MALLPSDPKQKNRVYLTVLPILLAGLYWNFMYGPKQDELDLKQNQLTKIEESNRVAQRQIREGQDLSKKLPPEVGGALKGVLDKPEELKKDPGKALQEGLGGLLKKPDEKAPAPTTQPK